MQKCPCCSGKSYEECCESVIAEQSAPTALALMRSRYSAYTCVDGEYLMATTHSRTRSKYNKEDLENWGRENQWTQLEIVSVEHGRINDDRGIVEFKAYFEDVKGQKHIHHERSNFIKENGKWYYVDGQINPQEVPLVKKVSRNDPCPCGSGKKYKKCCG
ncbi:YchJ family protein [Reichenbachiella ulvae]|uniref:YchJ family protein n=1 Tax=Reichenbachiella ulvae TaxID=2980104 RepID=A0ABT3CU00_9BACT|nr:YchJ family protein [Reichenbachiella ulvae]MCV9387177.1 YchJ family protein [Reichenbachiella ulvae]